MQNFKKNIKNLEYKKVLTSPSPKSLIQAQPNPKYQKVKAKRCLHQANISTYIAHDLQQQKVF